MSARARSRFATDSAGVSHCAPNTCAAGARSPFATDSAGVLHSAPITRQRAGAMTRGRQRQSYTPRQSALAIGSDGATHLRAPTVIHGETVAARTCHYLDP